MSSVMEAPCILRKRLTMVGLDGWNEAGRQMDQVRMKIQRLSFPTSSLQQRKLPSFQDQMEPEYSGRVAQSHPTVTQALDVSSAQ